MRGVRELRGDAVGVERVGSVRVECGGRRIGKLRVGDEADRAALRLRDFEQRAQRLAAVVEGDVAMIHAYSGRECGGGGGGIGHGEIARGIGDERGVGKGVEREPVLRAAFVKSRDGEMPREHSIADENDDAEMFLHDPDLEVEHAHRDEEEQAKEREQLVAELHRNLEARYNGARLAMAMRICAAVPGVLLVL